MWDEKKGQITVAALIDELKKQPPEALVWCHESGPSYTKTNRVEYCAPDNSVTIMPCD